MVKLLRKQTAAGVLIRKIDRSARNLRDWADLGELIDRGVEVILPMNGWTLLRATAGSPPTFRPSSLPISSDTYKEVTKERHLRQA